jgi:hypothetical protein
VTIIPTDGATLDDRGLRKWLSDDWTHRLIAYGVVVVTLSLIVQIIATFMIGQL